VFTVTLPTAGAKLQGNTPESGAGGRQVTLRGVRVLVVDDEPDACELVKRVLIERQAEVVTALSAEAALSAMRRAKPAVLVSDISMPEADGYSLLRRIREQSPDEGGRIPAIALTAFARAEDRARALESGFQAHVAKPVDADELCAAVVRVLDTSL
jgi:CheY-like chemotaxis protein